MEFIDENNENDLALHDLMVVVFSWVLGRKSKS